MRKSMAILAAMLLASFVASAQTAQERYISTWAPTAVAEMYRSGVPASITLAQGLLESRYGLSKLASEGNNHFGIKCHDWTGSKMYADDDRQGECFRVYGSAEESFRDHSDFLRYRDRYKFLFENPVTDYKAWAHGLKTAGYATDPSYATKLIKIIEDYGLDRYDRMPAPEQGTSAARQPKRVRKVVAEEGGQAEAEEQPVKQASGKAARQRRGRRKTAVHNVPAEMPQSPMSLEEPVKFAPERHGTFNFSLAREVYACNGVPFVYAQDGDGYAALAQENKLFLKEILSFNDLDVARELLPGDRVYLARKKASAEKGLDKYIVEGPEETLRDIAQRFGVKMGAIIKLNKFPANHVPREGDTILLR